MVLPGDRGPALLDQRSDQTSGVVVGEVLVALRAVDRAQRAPDAVGERDRAAGGGDGVQLAVGEIRVSAP